MRVAVDDSKENIEAYKTHLVEISEAVLEEFDSIGKARPEPTVMPGLDKLREEVAVGLIDIQKRNGVVSWSEISPLHKGRIQELQKKYKIPREQVIKRLANVRYLSYAQVEIQNYASVLEDIDNVYQKYAKQSGVFPLNALSKRTSEILKGYRVGVSFPNKVKLILQVFRPEMADIKIVQYDYTQTIKPAYYLSPEEFEGLAQEILQKFADKDRNIDKIFAPESEAYLKNLITVLKLNHITFDEFARKHNLEYSRCYIVPSVTAAKQMYSSYHSRYGTYRGLQDKDGYVCKKLDMVKLIEKRYTLRELLEYWGWESDNAISSPTLSETDLLELERLLARRIHEIYPTRRIGKGFNESHRPEYEKARMIASRKGYLDVDLYLASLGFTREKSERKTFKDKFCLSERDLFYYGFITSDMTPEQIENVLNAFEISFANVEDYVGFYRRLSYYKRDGFGTKQAKEQSQPH